MSAPRNQRLESPETALIAAFAGLQAGMWTALPAIVRKVDLNKQTLEAEPSVQLRIRQADQSFTWVTIPVCVDCPIIFPSGGGYTLTFPVTVGDECLLLFSSRCIDSWWQLGGVQRVPEFRMHDLSDGFALVGIRSQPRVLTPAPLATGVELRKDDHSAYINIDGSDIHLYTTGNNHIYSSGNNHIYSSGNTDVVAVGRLTLAATHVVISGPLEVYGDVVTHGTLINNSKDVGSTHKHSGVRSGGDTSGNPV